MHFLLLICLMVACLPLDWPEPALNLGWTGSILAVSGVCGSLILAAAIISRCAVRGLKRGSREQVAHWYDRASAGFFFANLISFWICLTYLGWGWSVHAFGTLVLEHEILLDGVLVTHLRTMYLPGMELVILAPYFVTMIGSWFFFYDAERKFHQTRHDADQRGTYWSRLGYISFHLRQQILMLLTVFVWIVVQSIVRAFPEWFNSPWGHYGIVALMPTLVVFCPLLIPWLLALRPLPVGPLRTRLEENARRLGFGYTNILLWDTKGGMANAMVVGTVPRIRYVIFTDKLLDELTPDELDGAFGHEVGHAWHWHIPFYAAFFILSFAMLGAIDEAARTSGWFDAPEWNEVFDLLPIPILCIYVFAVFGFISRRCERQADLFGCKAVSCNRPFCLGHDSSTLLPAGGSGLCRTGIGIFIQALRRVERINGMDRAQIPWHRVSLRGKFKWIWKHITSWLQSWQHSTLSKRVEFLERVANDLTLERQFQRRLSATKWAIILGLLAALSGMVVWKGWGILEASL